MNRFGLISLLLLSLAATTQADTGCTPNAGVTHLYNKGWGLDLGNKRYQSDTEINRSNVEALELKWVFALDEGAAPHSHPVVTEDTVFIGTTEGNLYALEKSSGCVRWRFEADSSIRSAVIAGQLSSGRTLLFFGTVDGFAYAIDAVSGAQAWLADAKDYPFSMITGTPLFHDDRLYVPVSSAELGLAINPLYGCCKFRGSLLALDAATGDVRWRTHTIQDEPKVTGRHLLFVEHWGPSGAPIWSAPALDPSLGLIYVGTGENYTRPTSDTSDAILAIDHTDGAIRWVQQYTAEDAFNMSCVFSANHPNCPKDTGPDLDFGAPPIVSRTAAGRTIVLAGQKSGGVYGIDADTGARLWSTAVGRGGYLGGIHWGMAVNESLGLLYAPVSDIEAGPVPEAEPDPGLHAVDISTGTVRWSAPVVDRCGQRELCKTGLSAAIIATEELVFAGGLDGYLEAFDASTGEVLWSYDTWREFDATTDTPTRGGSIDVHGPLVAGDMVLLTSGYGTFGQRGGNALIAWQLEAKPDAATP